MLSGDAVEVYPGRFFYYINGEVNINGDEMGKVILGVTNSLDGFAEDHNGSVVRCILTLMHSRILMSAGIPTKYRHSSYGVERVCNGGRPRLGRGKL